MTKLQQVLLWCVIINYVIVLFWFALFTMAHDKIYRLHRRRFRLSLETFDALNWLGMGLYKVGILLLNLVPLIALTLSAK